jgi:hypothetical protein
MRRTGRAAPSCRRRNTTRWRRDAIRPIRPRCRSGRGTSRCSRTASRRWAASCADRRQLIVPTAPADRALRSGGVHAGPAKARWAAAAGPHRAAAAGVGRPHRRIGARRTIQYVLPFENRGAEVGVTLHHPHGQIYAYPVVPPVPARMQQVAAEHYAKARPRPAGEHIEAERRDGRACCTKAACGRLRAGLRALSVRGVGRADRRWKASRSWTDASAPTWRARSRPCC